MAFPGLTHAPSPKELTSAATFWQWLERISWMVTVFGVVLVVLALLQLTRLLAELRSHSKLEVGFRSNPVQGPINDHQTSKALRHHPGWYRTTLTFITSNTGTRSARDIRINYVFPEDVQFPQAENEKVPRFADNDITTIPIEGDSLVVISNFPYLHPGTVHIDSLIIDVPEAWSDFWVTVLIFRSDSEKLLQILYVNLLPTDAPEAAAPTPQVLDALQRARVSDVADAGAEHESVVNRLRSWVVQPLPRLPAPPDE